MSPREQAQHVIAEFLHAHRRTFSAPYGVIEGMSTLPRGGKVRNITFGVARYLDAHITIFSPTRIRVEGQGALAYKVDGDYRSTEELIAQLSEAFELR